jgi:hypothetical protein
LKDGSVRRKKPQELLSNTVKVALQIYEDEIEKGYFPTASQLTEELSKQISPHSLLKALDTLVDLGICRVEMGSIGDNRNLVARKYRIVG